MQRPGEFVVLDRKPTVMLTKEHSARWSWRSTRAPGADARSIALYAGLTVGAVQATTTLVTNFVDELTRIEGRLSPDLATVILDWNRPPCSWPF